MIDYLDPTLAFGLAILLWGVYAWGKQASK